MSRVDALREAFDAGFAVARSEAEEQGEAFVLLTCGDSAAAVPLAALTALDKLPPLTRLPGAPSGLLGVGALRGAIVGVWALGDFLGQPRVGVAWLLTTGVDLGLAFDVFDGWLVVAPDRIHPDERGGRVLRLDDGVRPILDLDHIASQIRSHAERRAASQETR